MPNEYALVATERAMRQHIAQLNLDFEAAHVISSVYRAANAVRSRVTAEVLRPYGLTWTGFVVMWVVWIWDTIESRHAADAAAISKATLTGVVRTLEGHGWMLRTEKAGDRRKVELSLTPAGIALMQELYPKFNQEESRVVSGLSTRRRREVINSLRGIIIAIEAMDNDEDHDEAS